MAGIVALLVAKAFKISDRLAEAAKRPDRLADKDAGDVLRLFMGCESRLAAATAARLRASERVGAVASEGLALLADLFGRPGGRGVDMAVRALAGDIPEARVRALAPAFTAALMVDGGRGRG